MGFWCTRAQFCVYVCSRARLPVGVGVWNAAQRIAAARMNTFFNDANQVIEHCFRVEQCILRGDGIEVPAYRTYSNQ